MQLVNLRPHTSLHGTNTRRLLASLRMGFRSITEESLRPRRRRPHDRTRRPHGRSRTDITYSPLENHQEF